MPQMVLRVINSKGIIELYTLLLTLTNSHTPRPAQSSGTPLSRGENTKQPYAFVFRLLRRQHGVSTQ